MKFLEDVTRQPELNLENCTLPPMVIFALDYVFWPFYVESELHVVLPFHQLNNGDVVDSRGEYIRLYEDIPKILAELNQKGVKVAVASNIRNVGEALKLLEYFGIDKYIKYKEIYKAKKTKHLEAIQRKSGIAYYDMIYYDNDQDHLNEVKPLGVCPVKILDGLNYIILGHAMEYCYDRKLDNPVWIH